MYPRSFAKAMFALLVCAVSISATPMPVAERSAKTSAIIEIERVLRGNLFIVPFRSTASYQTLVSPGHAQYSYIAECWRAMVYDNLIGTYSSQVAESVAGVAYAYYPGLNETVEYAESQGVERELIIKILTNCIWYCGWE